MPDDKARPIAAHFKQLERVGGNFANVSLSSNFKVELLVAGESSVINDLNHAYERRTTAANSVIDFHDRHQAAFVSLFSKPKTCFDTVAGKIAVITACIKATQDVVDDPHNQELWWKCVLSWLSVFQLTTDVASWRYTRLARNELMKEGFDLGKNLLSSTKVRDVLTQEGETLSETATKRVGRYVVNAEVCALASKGITHLLTLMSVYDAWKGCMQLSEMKKKGALKRDMLGLEAKIVIDFVSTIVIGLCVSSCFLGFFLGLLIFGITSLFLKKRLVPECIQTWLRRSKYGVEQDTVLGQPFRDVDEEQQALLTLLKGITVTAQVETKESKRDKGSAWCEIGDAKILSDCQITSQIKVISLCVSIPDRMNGIISVDFSSSDSVIKIDNPSIKIVFNSDNIENNIALVKLDNVASDNYNVKDFSSIKKDSASASGSILKNKILAKGGEIIGDSFILNAGDDLKYVIKKDDIVWDEFVSFKKEKNHINYLVDREFYFEKSLASKKEILIVTISINSRSQLFNEVFRIPLYIKEEALSYAVTR